MIGYPGLEEVVIGGRGLWRAQVSVHAPAGHSGSSKVVLGAISRAAHLVRLLDEADLPRAPGAGAEFPLPPKVSVTAITGGQGFSVTPDLCSLNVDVRTTPAFTGRDAEMLVREAVARLDAELPVSRSTEVAEVACWPAFRLRPDEEPAAAMFAAARDLGLDVGAKVAGPSNIGNLLMREGFGVRPVSVCRTRDCTASTSGRAWWNFRPSTPSTSRQCASSSGPPEQVKSQPGTRSSPPPLP